MKNAFDSLVAQANLKLSTALSRSSLKYLNTVLEGGTVNLADQDFSILGLEKT